MSLEQSLVNLGFVPFVDFICQDDGDGAYIRDWLSSALRPTQSEIDGAPSSPPTLRRRVLKAVIEQRLIDAGLMDAAFAALSSSGVLFARWYSRISDSVFFDDPDALALLDAIGADPEVIMAPG